MSDPVQKPVPSAIERPAIEAITQDPTHLLRLAGMVREVRAEVTRVSLDEVGLARLERIHREVLTELRDVVAEDLREEIDAFSLTREGTRSESEVRLAQAQLAGWLEGLFAGVNAAMVTQQMRSMAQGRPRQLPGDDDERQSGQYL